MLITMAGEFWVHIWYPQDHEADDEPWLTAVAERYAGSLDPGVMLSRPAQRFASFVDADQAAAFAAELSSTDRWQAGAPYVRPTAPEGGGPPATKARSDVADK